VIREVWKSALNGLALAKDDDGKYGIIDAKGEWVVQPRFRYVWNFSANGLAMVVKFEDGWVSSTSGLVPTNKSLKYHYIDATGNFVVSIGLPSSSSAPMQWRRISDTRELLDAQGKVVLLVDRVCGVEVSKNLDDEITWPKKSVTQICEESAAIARYAAGQEAKERQAKAE
jgi:hypothetical protein